MSILLPSRRIIQPPGFAQIDRSNPLARGLVGLFDATTGFDLINGTRSTTNSTTISLVQKGKVGTFSNSVQEFPHTPKYAITGALTIFAPLVVTSLANYSGIISKSSNYVSFPFELRLGASATSSEIDFQRGNGSQASAFKGASSLISASPGVVQTLAVRCVSGDINIAPDVFVNKTKTTLARNGYPTVTGTATDNGQPLRIGNRFDSTTYLNGGIQYLGLWNRALLDSEILELSDNPWQIFKSQSRRVWVGVAGTAGLQANATGQATATGALTTAIPIAGAALSIASATGSMTTAIPLSGSAASVSTASGAMTAQIKLSAAALAQAVASAALSSGIILTASAVSQAAAQGTLASAIQMIASAAAQATASASLTAGGGLSANAAAQATASAALTVQIQIAASALAQATSSASLTTGGGLSASALAQAGASGTLTTQIKLTAAALAQAIASGGLTASINLSANAPATAQASGTLTAQVSLAGNAVAQATATSAFTGGFYADPRFTVALPARSFTVALPARGFEVTYAAN